MKIDHLAIAVRSIEESLKFYQQVLGLTVETHEVISEQGVRVAMLRLSQSHLELLEATDERSPVAEFIAKRGEGLHHICIAVEDMDNMLGQLKTSGVRVVDESPRCGVGGRKVVFLHPDSTHGVLIELTEKEQSTLHPRPSVVKDQEQLESVAMGCLKEEVTEEESKAR